MNNIDHYIHAATRDNTRKAYRAAVHHFEVEWGGFLPATADSIARYLADHASILAVNTLRQRLAGIAQWHIEQGFADPTKMPLVRKVLRGIQATHPTEEKQAKPLQLRELEQVDLWLAQQLNSAHGEYTSIRYLRDRAILLMGFWRGFRGDELSRLRVEHITVIAGEGISLYLPRTKTEHAGAYYKAPALSRLCPVAAYLQWVDAARLTEGAAFRSINRWGQVGDKPLHSSSFIGILRSLFAAAGIASSDSYSGHSLRRGFASWATANGWDLKALMEYVGWKDHRSALKYIDGTDPFSRYRIEQNLSLPAVSPQQLPPAETILELSHSLESYHTKGKALEKAYVALEACCLRPFKPEKTRNGRYRLTVPRELEARLDDTLYNLLDEMHQVAESHQCFLDAIVTNPDTEDTWQ